MYINDPKLEDLSKKLLLKLNIVSENDIDQKNQKFIKLLAYTELLLIQADHLLFVRMHLNSQNTEKDLELYSFFSKIGDNLDEVKFYSKQFGIDKSFSNFNYKPISTYQNISEPKDCQKKLKHNTNIENKDKIDSFFEVFWKESGWIIISLVIIALLTVLYYLLKLLTNLI